MKKVKAIKIPADINEGIEEVTLEEKNDDYFLQSLQDAVHGWIERVIIGDCRSHKRFQGVVMYVNEESAIRPGFEVNPRASILYGSPVHGHVIFGDVLLSGEGDEGVSNLPVGFNKQFLEKFLAEFMPTPR